MCNLDDAINYVKNLSFILLFLTFVCSGQTLIHTDLSRIYNYKTSLSRLKTKSSEYSCIIKIQIINKSDKKIVQTISIYSDYMFSDAYNDKDAKRSFITGKNKNKPDTDNDYGDIIIADFNFDSKEDVALKKDWGGNGGSTYNYYTQDANGKFVLDKFLTNRMEFFPTYINRKKKTLTTLVHANAYEMCKTTYKIDSLTQAWKKTGRTFVKY